MIGSMGLAAWSWHTRSKPERPGIFKSVTTTSNAARFAAASPIISPEGYGYVIAFYAQFFVQAPGDAVIILNNQYSGLRFHIRLLLSLAR